jgi:2-oxoglutarate ferredoxin oxidoreductase subunit beta
VSATANPPRKTNRIGLDVLGYRGSKTTLCAGCGHNAISERIVEVFFEMGIQPWSVAKFSGIGCSSKSPAYFLSLSHGFNAVHGRAPAVATGAMLANRNLLGMIVTGDGDTASIGIGQYMHLLRRNLDRVGGDAGSAVVFRRQEAASGDPESLSVAQGALSDRRDQPLHDVQ